MSVLKSRPISGQFRQYESLQLGNSLTYAEESFRQAAAVALKDTPNFLRRDIIVPTKKDRPQAISRDAEGAILQGELAEIVARSKWDDLSKKQKDQIYNKGDLQYRAENDDRLERRVAFFRAIVRIKNEAMSKLVLAKVTAYAISGWWHMAEVQIWHRPYFDVEDKGGRECDGARFQVDSRVYDVTPKEGIGQPPEFLQPK